MQTETPKTNGAHANAPQVPVEPAPIKSAAEKFAEKKAAKRAAKEAKKEAAKPVDTLKEEDRLHWLLLVESVKRCEAELNLAQSTLNAARKNHQETIARIFRDHGMVEGADGANLMTGEIVRKANGKP